MSKRTLGGLELRDLAAELLLEVESIYGRSVRVREAAQDEVYAETQLRAAATVTSNGDPEIITYPGYPLSEEAIVHELFHLKGPLPTTKFSFQLDPNLNLDFQVLDQLRNTLVDPIEHQLFFPKMREMGLAPEERMRTHLAHVLSGADLAEVPQLLAKWYRPLYYFGVALEIGSAVPIGRLRRYYTKRSWDRDLHIGKRMVDAVKDTRGDLDSILIGVIKCLNIFYEGRASFELASITPQIVGAIQFNDVVLTTR